MPWHHMHGAAVSRLTPSIPDCVCREGVLAAEALAHAVAPYLQLLGADSERRRLQVLALRALGPALAPIGGESSPTWGSNSLLCNTNACSGCRISSVLP
jgi:hypothetical protein